MDTEPHWRALTIDDLPAVAALAKRCLATDGGLPLVTDVPFLTRRFAADGGVARGVLDPAGTLIAAGAVRPQETNGVRRAVATGLVDPAHRGQGMGAALLDWALDPRGVDAERVTVETEALTDPARALFSARGLRQTFAEDVLRFDLTGTGLPRVDLPAGLTVTAWSTELAERFFAVYQDAFRERPGFPGWDGGAVGGVDSRRRGLPTGLVGARHRLRSVPTSGSSPRPRAGSSRSASATRG